MVDPTRLELVTFSMSRKRSNQLSYGSINGTVVFIWAGRDLAPYVRFQLICAESSLRVGHSPYKVLLFVGLYKQGSFQVPPALLLFFMGGEGLEPSQPCGHRILSPTCIPIPPPARDFHKYLEARTGIEPVNSGFADRCLTTWLPRRY